MRKTLGVTIYIVRASNFICTQDYKAFKINTSCKLSNYNKPGGNDFGLEHSCCRGVVHFPAHKTTLLTLTLRHSNTSKSNMNGDSTKGKNKSQKTFTLPLSPIQQNSCNLTKPQAVNTRHQMVTTHKIKNQKVNPNHQNCPKTIDPNSQPGKA
jgi:hypothetical protein